MVHIEIAHTFPVTVSHAFACITDIKNWPDYWPNFVRFEDQKNYRWSKPGDEPTMVLKLLNRERALTMMLTDILCKSIPERSFFICAHSGR